MKTVILVLSLILGISFIGKGQQYKAKHISYQSETKNEVDGSTMAIYKYENFKLTVSNTGKELITANTKDAVIQRFFTKIPWSNKAKCYATGVHEEDAKKGEKISYYIQAEPSKDLKTIKLAMITRNELTGKVIDDILILFNRIK